MPGKPTKVYPIRGRYLADQPARVTIVSTKGAADRLVESGAFTDNPNHPERDHDAPNDAEEPVAVEQPAFQGEVPSETTPGEPSTAPTPETEEE